MIIAGLNSIFGIGFTVQVGPNANKIGGLADAGFLHIAVDVVHLAPARPAAPQHVKHLVALGVGVVAGQEFVGEGKLVIQGVFELIGEFAVDGIAFKSAKASCLRGGREVRVGSALD